MTADRPHLRVVEYAQGVAGPVCGRLFAALGHEVVKVEPPEGDRQRTLPPYFSGGAAEGDSLSFHYHSLAKKLRTIDLATSVGQQQFGDLLGWADVLIVDLLPEEAHRVGLTAQQLRASHPRLTVVSVTAFGMSDENSELAGDSLLAEAFGGLVAMVGEPERSPLSLGGRQAEYSAGVAAFLGACVSLAARGDDGMSSSAIDVAATDVAAYFDWKSEATIRAGGAAPNRTGRGGRWKLFDARDGQVGLIYQPPQWLLVCSLVPVEELRDERFATQAGRDQHDAEWSALVAEWIAGQSATEVARRGQEIGLALEALASVADVARSPQFLARGFLQRVDSAEFGSAVFPGAPAPAFDWAMEPAHPLAESLAREPADADSPPWWRRGTEPKPLSGVTVLDMGQITAGAALSRLLADFGARVIKVESPKQPDPMRLWGLVTPDSTELSPLFAPNNVGKEAITLDLKTVRGRELFLQLAAQCDVVVENFAAGVTDRLGVGFDDVMAVNDRIVYASLSGHGQHGPDARNKSYGSTLDLVSGTASVTGYPGYPIWSSFDLNYPDQLVSLHGAALVVHSLLTRQTGLHLDISQAEVVASTIGDLIAAYGDSGAIPGPTGNARDYASPHDVYRCEGPDNWVAISVRDARQLDALTALVGAGAFGDDRDIDQAIADWAAQRDKRTAAAELRRAGVSAVPVLTAEERHVEPRFERRGVFTSPADSGVKGLPFVLSPSLLGSPRPAPTLSHDTEGILAEFCGVDASEFSTLVAAGVVLPID